MQSRRPKLIVFDLDCTLWPFWVDTHVTPPFKKASDGKVYDKRGQHIKYYPDVPEVLEKLKNEGYTLGIASRTEYPEGAEKLLTLFNWNQYFTYKEIYPGCKVTHFNSMHRKSDIPLSEMMFFDDEHRNISDVGALGVSCIFVKNGVTHALMEDALKKFAGI